MSNTVGVAAVNFHDTWGDKEANLAKMARFIRSAQKRAKLIVFPEVALTGYEDDEHGTMHRKLAETIPGPATDAVAKEAKRYGVYVAFGMPERERKDPSTLYNSAVLIAPYGDVIHVYRKAHPWLPEFTWCQKGPGDYEPAETTIGSIGLMICYDTYIFPEVARILALKGARLLLNLTAAPDYEGWEIAPYMINQVKARSIENLVFVASANLVGNERTLNYVGSSLITGPKYPATTYTYAGPASATHEEMLVARLDYKTLDQMRDAIPHFVDRRPATYQLLHSPLANGSATAQPLARPPKRRSAAR